MKTRPVRLWTRRYVGKLPDSMYLDHHLKHLLRAQVRLSKYVSCLSSGSQPLATTPVLCRAPAFCQLNDHTILSEIRSRVSAHAKAMLHNEVPYAPSLDSTP